MLYRDASTSDALRRAGIAPVQGDLALDTEGVIAVALRADAVVYAAQLPFEAEPGLLG